MAFCRQAIWGRWAAAAALFIVVPSAGSVPIRWEVNGGGNGHLYEVVLVPQGISWPAAESRARVAPAAHLATVTSAAEHEFVQGLLRATPAAFWDGLHGPWIGGRQRAGAPEPGGGWQWATGEAFSFAPWGIGEPNNGYGGGSIDPSLPFGTNEDALHYKADLAFNDIPRQALMGGYVVESRSIPEPSTAVLLLSALGVVLNALGRREKKGKRISSSLGKAAYGPRRFGWGRQESLVTQ